MNRVVLIVGSVLTAALLFVLFAGLGKDPSAIDSPLIGKSAPPFALKAVGTGQTIDLTQHLGKPLVLNFWATWCRPCWDEHPTLTESAQMMGERVQFIGVVFQDDEKKILDFLRQRGSAYPTVVDDRGKTAIAYGIGGVPETFFLDAKGTIVAKHSGPLSPELLQTYVTKAMNP
jgi:cytochrome c biogenesis protein CcmG, thiol:disulfide interchange protein DsbE